MAMNCSHDVHHTYHQMQFDFFGYHVCSGIDLMYIRAVFTVWGLVIVNNVSNKMGGNNRSSKNLGQSKNNLMVKSPGLYTIRLLDS